MPALSMHGDCVTERKLVKCGGGGSDEAAAKALMAQMKAKPTLMLVWADWCGYCKEAMPAWLEFQHLYLSDPALSSASLVFDIESKKRALLTSSEHSPPHVRNSGPEAFNAFPQMFFVAPGDQPKPVDHALIRDPPGLIAYLRAQVVGRATAKAVNVGESRRKTASTTPLVASAKAKATATATAMKGGSMRKRATRATSRATSAAARAVRAAASPRRRTARKS